MMCYCGHSNEFSNCCGIYINDGISAPSPELLMRSRYSAFTVKNMEYLLETHDPQTRGQFDRKANLDWAETSRFSGLEILRTEVNGSKGIVEFRVTYEDLKNHKIIIHHEISKFRKQNNIWFFREGKAKNN